MSEIFKNSRCITVSTLALLLGGCDFKEDPYKDGFGYIEVRADFDIRSGDKYMYGDRQFSLDSSGKLDSVFKEPIGTAEIVFERRGRSYNICNASVRINRITSVVIYDGPGGITCKAK